MLSEMALYFVNIFEPQELPVVRPLDWYLDRNYAYFYPDTLEDPDFCEELRPYLKRSYLCEGEEGKDNYTVEEIYVLELLDEDIRFNDHLLKLFISKLIDKELKDSCYYHLPPDIAEILNKAAGVPYDRNINAYSFFVRFEED